MCDWCGEGWRFDATDLYTGVVKAVLHPISAEWEDAYSMPASGSVTLATRDPSPADIFAGETGVYISQVKPDGSRAARFGGFAEKYSGTGGGDTPLAVHSMDTFLDHCVAANTDVGYTITNTPVSEGSPEATLVVSKPDSSGTLIPVYSTLNLYGQAGYAALLVKIAAGNVDGEGFTGLPNLTAVVDAPAATATTQSINWWDFKNIGQALRELVEAENGVKYWLEHVYTDGVWATVIHFSDKIGTDRDYVLTSDREGWDYSLDVDAKDKASRVYGVGSGNEQDTQFSVAYDQQLRLPEWRTSQAWKDKTDPATIDTLTRGWVSDHRDPTAIPAMTVVGLPIYSPDDPQFDPQHGFPAPEICAPGDTFGVELGYGVITIRDIRCRCLGVSWRLDDGNPVQRTIAMQPVLRPSLSIRTQTAAKPPAGQTPVQDSDPQQGATGGTTVTPYPTPGLLTKVHPNYLHEISGMQVSYANPGHVWVHNDNEVAGKNPVGTVYLIPLSGPSKGNLAGKFHVAKPGGGQLTDTEGIRYRASDRTLWIGDIGDNPGTRSSGALYVLPEPAGGGDKGLLPSTRIRIKYPFGGGWVNTETLMINPLTGTIETITKEAGKGRVVTFGANPTDNMVGTRVCTIEVPDKIVDGCYSHDARFAFLRAEYYGPTLVYDTSSVPWRQVGKIDTPAMPKPESISLDLDTPSCSFIVGTEAKPHAPVSETETPIYRVLIPAQFGALCGTPAGPAGTGGTSTSPAGVPGDVLDLTRWKLTLPI